MSSNALFGCLVFDHIEILEEFLESDPKSVFSWRSSSHRMNCFHVAAASGSVSCLRLLLRFCVEHNDDDNGGLMYAQDDMGATPLIRALLKPSLSCATALLMYKNNNDNENVARLASCCNMAFGKDQETALHIAVDLGEPALLMLLIAAGADASVKDAAGESCFARAACRAPEDVLTFATLVPCNPQVALMEASRVNSPHGCALALGSGATLTPEPGRKTALMAAAANGSDEALAFLLEQGSDPNAVTRGDRTALMYAARRGHRACVELLKPVTNQPFVDAAAAMAKERGHFALLKILSPKKGKKQKQQQQQQQQQEKPIEMIRRTIREKRGDAISEDMLKLLPSKWQLVGHVVLLQGVAQEVVAAFGDDVWKDVGDAYLSCPQVRAETVALETETPHGELRVPSVRVIAGRLDTLTVHTEDGIRYWIDPCKVMFSSGNGTERMHFHRNVVGKPDDIVVDMFAGIGYFTVPLACSASGVRPARIFALEKNPDSARFLRMNVEENAASNIVLVCEGDNREVANEAVGCAQRVLMGYIPTPVEFIPRALSFLSRVTGGTIHYHFVATKEEHMHLAQDHFKNPCAELGWTIKSVEVRKVKDYAPKRLHYVADIVLSSSIP